MSAGFRYTVNSQPRVLVLTKPMAFEPAPSHRKNRWAVDSLDLSGHEVISIASGRMEVEATVRFERKAQALVDMMQYAADGVPVTYYPDLSVNTGYALWLIGAADEVGASPMQGRWSLGDYTVRTRWRDASASGTSLEALFSPWLFRLDGGQFPTGAVFTRSGTAWQRGQFGALESVADGLARTEWVMVNGLRVPATLLEVGRVNPFTHSDDLTHSDWTKGASSVVANQAIGPYGTATLEELVEDGTLAWHSVFQQVTITADAVVALSAFVMANTRDYCQLALRDAGAITTNYVRARFDLTDGSVRSTAAAGTGTFVRAYVEDWTDVAPGLYRVVLVGSVGNSATAIQGRCHMLSADGAFDSYTGDGSSSIYAGGMQIENNAHQATTYIPTTTASATRGSEDMTIPFPPGVRTLTGYVKFIERGAVVTAGSYARAYSIGGETSDGIRLLMRRDQGTPADRYELALFQGAGQIAYREASAGPTIGDLVEHFFTLDVENGQIDFSWSHNGGAITSSGSSAGTFDEVIAQDGWSEDLISIEQGGGGNAFLSMIVVPGIRTPAEMRAL